MQRTCWICGKESNAPLNIKSFSNAILNHKSHDNVYIAICPPLRGCVGHTDFNALEDSLTKEIVFAIWYYELRNFSVRIMFAKKDQLNRQGLEQAWHPSNINKDIKIASTN